MRSFSPGAVATIALYTEVGAYVEHAIAIALCHAVVVGILVASARPMDNIRRHQTPVFIVYATEQIKLMREEWASRCRQSAVSFRTRACIIYDR